MEVELGFKVLNLTVFTLSDKGIRVIAAVKLQGLKAGPVL